MHSAVLWWKFACRHTSRMRYQARTFKCTALYNVEINLQAQGIWGGGGWPYCPEGIWGVSFCYIYARLSLLSPTGPHRALRLTPRLEPKQISRDVETDIISQAWVLEIQQMSISRHFETRHKCFQVIMSRKCWEGTKKRPNIHQMSFSFCFFSHHLF